MILCLMMIGCGKPASNDFTRPNENTWGMPEINQTGVDPKVGPYRFIGGRGSFSVIQDANTGKKYVRFASDSYRFDNIEIYRGGFMNCWGSTNGQGHCPTDAYAISGSFVDETTAKGMVKYGSGGRITSQAAFVATLRE